MRLYCVYKCMYNTYLLSTGSFGYNHKQAKFQEMVLSMVKKNVNLPTKPTAVKPKNTIKDGVNAYAQEVLTLTLIWAEFEDAIREGDGLRVIRCWRFMLLIFKAANRTNYSKEAITLGVVPCLPLPTTA